MICVFVNGASRVCAMCASMICCVGSLVCAVGLVFVSLSIQPAAIMFLVLLMPLAVCVLKHADVMVCVLPHSLLSPTTTHWLTGQMSGSLNTMFWRIKSTICSSSSRPRRQQRWLSFTSLQCCHHGGRRSRVLPQALLLSICSSRALPLFQLKSKQSKCLIGPRKLPGGFIS